jgi:uncharacterized protein
MKLAVVSFVSGVVFAAGLALSGMTQPAKVLGFLDVFGGWDPTLAFVMAGAIVVAAWAFRSGHRPAPAHGSIDAPLVAGAVIFGVGWGLTGLCPGPAIVSLASGRLGPWVFVAAMAVGIASHRLLARRFDFTRSS